MEDKEFYHIRCEYVNRGLASKPLINIDVQSKADWFGICWEPISILVFLFIDKVKLSGGLSFLYGYEGRSQNTISMEKWWEGEKKSILRTMSEVWELFLVLKNLTWWIKHREQYIYVKQWEIHDRNLRKTTNKDKKLISFCQIICTTLFTNNGEIIQKQNTKNVFTTFLSLKLFPGPGTLFFP